MLSMKARWEGWRELLCELSCSALWSMVHILHDDMMMMIQREREREMMMMIERDDDDDRER